VATENSRFHLAAITFAIGALVGFLTGVRPLMRSAHCGTLLPGRVGSAGPPPPGSGYQRAVFPGAAFCSAPKPAAELSLAASHRAFFGAAAGERLECTTSSASVLGLSGTVLLLRAIPRCVGPGQVPD